MRHPRGAQFIRPGLYRWPYQVELKRVQKSPPIWSVTAERVEWGRYTSWFEAKHAAGMACTARAMVEYAEAKRDEHAEQPKGGA